MRSVAETTASSSYSSDSLYPPAHPLTSFSYIRVYMEPRRINGRGEKSGWSSAGRGFRRENMLEWTKTSEIIVEAWSYACATLTVGGSNCDSRSDRVGWNEMEWLKGIARVFWAYSRGVHGDRSADADSSSGPPTLQPSGPPTPAYLPTVPRLYALNTLYRARPD